MLLGTDADASAGSRLSVAVPPARPMRKMPPRTGLAAKALCVNMRLAAEAEMPAAAARPKKSRRERWLLAKILLKKLVCIGMVKLQNYCYQEISVV